MKLRLLEATLRVFVFSGTLGCASATASRTQHALEIAIRGSDVPIQRHVGATSFAVTVVAKNEGPLRIYLSQCMWDAQRLIDKRWTTAYLPTCPGIDSYFQLASGDSAVFPLTITDYDTDPAPHPGLSAGQYRLRFGIGLGKRPDLRDPSVFVTVTSSPFFVRE